MKNHFIYTLEDPRNPGVIRYVGRTNNPTKRLNEHKRCRGRECHKIHWIKSVLNDGSSIKMDVIDECPPHEVEELEEFYISYFKFLGCNLTNSTGKSFGVVNHSPETIEKMSAIQSSRRAEVNDKISRSLIGIPMDASRREKHLLRVNSPEWKAKMSQVHKGKTLTESQRQHLSKIRSGWKWNEETKRKISAAHKGKAKSPEHIKKIADTQRGSKRGPQTPEQIAARMASTRATKELKKQFQSTNPI